MITARHLILPTYRRIAVRRQIRTDFVPHTTAPSSALRAKRGRNDAPVLSDLGCAHRKFRPGSVQQPCNGSISALSCNTPRETGRIGAYWRGLDSRPIRPDTRENPYVSWDTKIASEDLPKLRTRVRFPSPALSDTVARSFQTSLVSVGLRYLHDNSQLLVRAGRRRRCEGLLECLDANAVDAERTCPGVSGSGGRRALATLLGGSRSARRLRLPVPASITDPPPAPTRRRLKVGASIPWSFRRIIGVKVAIIRL